MRSEEGILMFLLSKAKMESGWMRWMDGMVFCMIRVRWGYGWADFDAYYRFPIK
jgi:hypothetical protein